MRTREQSLEADPRSPTNHLPEENAYLHHIRQTPLVPICLDKSGIRIWCKLEFLNPSGSTKDRIARHILEKAWRQNQLSKGSTVVEASSGSTSIAFALACSQMGLRFVAFIPQSATSERELIIRAYGGMVRRVPGSMRDVLRAAREASEAQGWFLGRQFANEANTEAHRIYTGPEILNQIPGGCVDAVVSGVGTGGTLRGLYEAFLVAKELGSDSRIVTVFPDRMERYFSHKVFEEIKQRAVADNPEPAPGGNG